MKSILSLCTFCWLAAPLFADDAEPSWQIEGKVVGLGTPTDDFDVAAFWSSNGKQWDENGTPIKVAGLAEVDKLWSHEGVLAAYPTQTAQRLPGGRFSIDVGDRPRVTLYAVDRVQARGGIAMVERNDRRPVEIALLPLVRVTGTVYCPEAGRTPDWTLAGVRPPGDKENYLKFIDCGSLQGKFSFLLPPGLYDFQVYSSSPDAKLAKGKPKDSLDQPAPFLHGILLEVPAGKPTLDLGQIDVELPRDKDGIGRDYSQFYGRRPPELAITDAVGLPAKVQLADLRGKWVLLDFWTLHCGPCIYSSLPELRTFCDQHAADRDRFEFLAICDTSEDKAPTVADFDRLAAPIVEKAWAGKPLPFPVLIDGDGRTTSVYGIRSWPTTLLVDPDGNLVKNGDLALLAEKLKERSP